MHKVGVQKVAFFSYLLIQRSKNIQNDRRPSVFLSLRSKRASIAAGGAGESEQVYNAYHIAGDFRSGRRRQVRVMDRSASQLLIRFTNCLWNLFLVMANVKSALWWCMITVYDLTVRVFSTFFAISVIEAEIKAMGGSKEIAWGLMYLRGFFS